MSDSMSAGEIEDVLSSIRRLVSEDLRPTHRLVAAALQNGAKRLILTPALRVVSDVNTALPERDDGLDDRQDLQTVLLEIDAQEAQPTQPVSDTAPFFGSVRLQDPQDISGAGGSWDADALVSDANFLATAMSRINGLSALEKDPARPDQSETIEAVVAVVGAAVGPDEWEPDGGEPAPQAQAWAGTLWAHDPSAAAANDSLGPEIGLLHASETDVVSLTGAPMGSDVDHAAEVDPVSGEATRADPAFAQTSSADDLLGADCFVLGGADHERDEIIKGADTAVQHRDVGQDVADAYEDDIDDGVDYDTGFLNEDLLRAIVSDMIREELQGGLGERITRNIRKLVRSEINRALASRDFDVVANRG